MGAEGALRFCRSGCALFVDRHGERYGTGRYSNIPSGVGPDLDSYETGGAALDALIDAIPGDSLPVRADIAWLAVRHHILEGLP